MEKGIRVGKVLGLEVILSAVAILFLSFLVWKVGLSKEAVNSGVVVIYLAVNFIGGFLIGKGMGKRKFLWGLIQGACYFLLVFLISCAIHKGFYGDIIYTIRILLFSVGGGMIGGMLG